jgi:STE24 endopeptidase
VINWLLPTTTLVGWRLAVKMPPRKALNVDGWFGISPNKSSVAANLSESQPRYSQILPRRSTGESRNRISMMQRTFLALVVFVASTALISAGEPVQAQAKPAVTTPTIPSARRLDPAAATQAYVAKLTPEQIAKSNSYFEGGYWLILWNFLVSAGLSIVLLVTGLSARMRNLAERVWPFPFAGSLAHTLVYGAQYFLFTMILGFPLTIYQDFFREREYGLSDQPLGDWLKDQAIGIALGAVIGGIAIMVLYAILRRVQKSWWIWASVATVALLFALISLAPVYIAPLFNKYETLNDPKVRDPILSLARANEIPADQVYVFDESKQSKRASANVSGAFGTMRISLTDNLLNRCSLAAVRAVMAHEMGHYVFNHVYKGIMELGLLMTVGFAFVAWGFNRIVSRYGQSWGIRSIADPAGLPLIVLLITAYFFVMTPVKNTIIRTQETEADAFGLNAAREPDGFAEAALMLSEYRKMQPGKWEEIVFYDHPSGYNRILMAMTWKAEQVPLAAH